MAEMAHDVHWHHGDGNTRNGRGKVSWINGSSRKMYPRIRTVSELIPSVLKNFDNVVKEYTYLAGNILISIVCSKLYPDKFEFDGFIILSLALLFAGIYIYEGFSEKNKAKKRKQEQD